MLLFWFVVFIVLLFIEIITINLVSIWFAIGALASMITSVFTNSLEIQLVVFTIISIISLLVTRPIVSKLRKREIQATNLDRVLNMDGVVTKDIVVNEVGEVKVDGKRWSAISKSNISVNSIVKIIRIDGVKLIVEKKENDNL